MYLKKISIINYKNFASKSFDFDSKINCLVGNNGVGKTNVLDAIYYLANTKGYFNSISGQNIKHGEEFFVLDGIFDKRDREEHVHCSFKKGLKKVIKRNGKEYEKISDHFGLIPLVIISPSDTDLIVEGSDLRRKYMDSIISLSDRDYLKSLINYNKILSQRNSLLKYFAANHTFDALNIEVYNEQMINFGKELFAKREKFIKEFVPIFKSRYQHIISKDFDDNYIEDVDLLYKTQLRKISFNELLSTNLEKDRILQYTSVGVHKDDLLFKNKWLSYKENRFSGTAKIFFNCFKTCSV